MSSKAGRASAPTTSPLCVMCTAGVDEMVTHAVCDCAMYAARRAAAWAEIEAVGVGDGAGTTTTTISRQQWHGMSSDARARWLLSCGAPAVPSALHAYLHDLFRQRGEAATHYAG